MGTLKGSENLAVMPRRTLLIFATIAAVIFCVKSTAENLNADIETTFQRYITATDLKRPDDIVYEIHTQSPFYLSTIQQINQLFPIYDIQVSLNEFHYLGSYDTYRFAVAIQSFKKRSGPTYQDYKSKSVVAFREEQGKWRIWTIVTIESHLIQ